MQAPSAQRTALIKLIHVARRDLERAGKMDEPTYRTMLRTAGHADSTTKMDVPALKRVLEQAKKAGFKVRPKAGDRRQDTSPEARKVRALWLFLYELGVVKNPAESALALYVKRIAKVDDLHWADGEAMLALIETQKRWAMRFLPAAVASLEAEALAMARAQKLSPEQLHACQRAHALADANTVFDRHWAAWSILTAVVGRLVPPAVAKELGVAAA